MPMRLDLKDVSVDRGGLPVLEGVTLSLEAGSALVIRGPNGAGKSTLLRAILGFVPLRAGEISLERDRTKLDISEHAHGLGHLNATSPALSVQENLHFLSRFLGGGPNAVGEALDRLDLRALADIPVKLLSAGQKRRVGLARLLVADRPLWLLDEPTTSLDAKSTQTVETLIAEHLGRSGLVLVATHAALDIPDARALTLQVGRPTDAALEATA